MYQTILHYLDGVLRNKISLANRCSAWWRIKKKKKKKKAAKVAHIEFLVELKKPGGEVFTVLCCVDWEWLHRMLQCMDGWGGVMGSFWWKSLWMEYHVCHNLISKVCLCNQFCYLIATLNSDFVVDLFKLVYCNSVEHIFIIKTLALFQQK
jgi:hypothetical protein